MQLLLSYSSSLSLSLPLFLFCLLWILLSICSWPLCCHCWDTTMSYLPKTPTSNYPSSPRSTPAPNHSLSPSTQLFVLSKPQEAQTSILTKRFSSKATDFLTRKQSKAKSSTTTSIQQLKPQSQRRSSLVKFSPTTPPESSFNFWESSSSEFRR